MHSAGILARRVAELSGARLPFVERGRPSDPASQVLIGALESDSELKRILLAEGIFPGAGPAGAPATLKDLGDQGFVVAAAGSAEPLASRLVVAGGGAPGLLYAVSALADRLHWEDDCLVVDGLGTPLLPAVNIPAFNHRSTFTGIGGPEWVAPDQYMKEFGYDVEAFVDWLAGHKFNNLLIHNFVNLCWGINYDSSRFPEMVNRFHPNVRKEFMGDLIRHARRRHIRIMFGIDLPDLWCGALRVHPEWAGCNVDWTCFPQGKDWESYQRCEGEWRYNWMQTDGNGRETVAHGKAYALRNKASWVCLAKPEVKAFWEAYWREVLERYPEVDAIGGQFCEHLPSRCACEKCAGHHFYDLAYEYFRTMESIAKEQAPGRRTWLWAADGARRIWEHKSQHPDLLWIDWGLPFPPFFLGHAKPASEWYLCHDYGRTCEFGAKAFCAGIWQAGLKGVQIRGLEFKEGDRHYRAFGEFMWNPDLSIEDFARLQVLKELRRKDAAVTAAYVHLIKCRGYRDILRYLETPRPPRAGATGEQADAGQYRQKLSDERDRLVRALEVLKSQHPFADWIRTQATRWEAL